ncbi:hypothetical protein E5K00_11595 [Hymenobacter aquaticus]|uniref:Uncharacterized protein n=1 Tax=Hymenobacter aquaticus TaxID=1867101 RepID=A0A4Z0Q6U2_9BACT|nr:hypothetical protein E5K00_11595 [Hymenobacter aquaticus]
MVLRWLGEDRLELGVGLHVGVAHGGGHTGRVGSVLVAQLAHAAGPVVVGRAHARHHRRILDFHVRGHLGGNGIGAVAVLGIHVGRVHGRAVGGVRGNGRFGGFGGFFLRAGSHCEGRGARQQQQ